MSNPQSQDKQDKDKDASVLEEVLAKKQEAQEKMKEQLESIHKQQLERNRSQSTAPKNNKGFTGSIGQQKRDRASRAGH